MRLILGLDNSSAGSVTIDGKPFAQVYSAMREVGALLDAKAVHGGRSACNHLWCLAATNASRAARLSRSSASSACRTWRGAQRPAGRHTIPS
jgi:ABC-2 type transport system ATP-binding protein